MIINTSSQPENEPVLDSNTESGSSSPSNPSQPTPQPSTSGHNTRSNPFVQLLPGLPTTTRPRKQPSMAPEASTTSKPKFQRFAGAKSKIKISSWLSLFEVLATRQEITDDKKKICFLMEYLEDEALQFYADEVAPKLDTITWVQTKTAITTRFGERTIDPVLAASRRRWNRGHENVQEYYEEKMFLLRKTGLSEASMAEVLTDGMPFGFRNNLISATITDTSEWLNKAVRLESSFGTQPKSEPRAIAAMAAMGSNFKPQAQRFKSKRPPPGPCKFCKSLGKSDPESNHWQSDCKNKPAGTRPQANHMESSGDHEAHSAVSLNQ